MNNKSVKKFIRERSELFWYIKDDKKEDISEESLVEHIFNYGTMNDVRKLFKLLRIDKCASIFYKQVSRERVNYKHRTANFFDLVFRKYASNDIIRKSAKPITFDKNIFR